MHRQEVISLELPPGLRQRLLAAGFRTRGDLEGIAPQVLAQETGMTNQDALEVLRVAGTPLLAGWTLAGARTAYELYQVQSTARKVITFCSGLDRILGGGVSPGQVTEFCGVPGVGKTQLGIQLAVDVQIPATFGGVGGAAVYIDTEGSFMIDRVRDIAAAAVQHIQSLGIKSGKVAQAADFTEESILTNIYYFRVHDHTDQVALVNMLDSFIQSQPKVKLIVIDSITFHFRQDFKDMGQRTRVLTQMAQDLMSAAEKHQVAVVLMNQVTTKVSDDRASKLVPALGDSWAHAASTRVVLFWQGSDRHAYIYKSSHMPQATAPYRICLAGVRDMRVEKRRSDALLDQRGDGHGAAGAGPPQQHLDTGQPSNRPRYDVQ